MENQKYSQEKVDIFWNMFLKKTGRAETTKYLDIFHFELTEKLANKLLRLVLTGQKKATASSLRGYELEGEDDTLESWRAGHIRFFKEEGNELGYEFSNDMPVVFEDFEIVYQV